MIYESKPQRIPQSRREAYNRRILRSIERNDGSMTREEIFNGYSGLGGLHKLKLSDYNSPYEFSQAKKESEIGQFSLRMTCAGRSSNWLHRQRRSVFWRCAAAWVIFQLSAESVQCLRIRCRSQCRGRRTTPLPRGEYQHRRYLLLSFRTAFRLPVRQPAVQSRLQR